MSEAVIQLESVNKTYGTGAAETKAVSDLSMTIERGSWVAIMGPSGHGKSTLLQLIGGLDRPTSGRIVVDGSELGRLDAAALAGVRARKIGFVFQFFNLMPHLTALENVEIALWLGGEKRNGRANALLERFDLTHRAQHLPSMLSGGQQQRVAIARALANDPDVLLMDEPTGNLDSAAEADLLALLSELHREDGKTLLMVTHNPAVAARAERVLQVKDGRIVADARNATRVH